MVQKRHFDQDYKHDYDYEYEKDYKKDYEKDYNDEYESDEEEYGYGKEQRHVHEFLGSVMIAERKEDPHNHRFAGVSGQAIPYGRSHIHKIETKTDFYEEHFHNIFEKSGEAIPVGKGRHVHFVKGETTFNDGHRHDFIVATLIEDPTGDVEKDDKKDKKKDKKKKDYDY